MKKLLVLLIAAVAVNCTPSREKVLSKMKDKMTDPDNPIVLMKTSEGSILLEVFRHAAPVTADNFIGLAEGTKEFTDKDGKKAKANFYDGLVFHRVIGGFMIQGGDINGNGTGGPGFEFADEINSEALGLDTTKIKDAPFYQRDIQMSVYKKLGIRDQASFEKNRTKLEAEVKKASEMTVAQLLISMGYAFTPGLKSERHVKYTLAMANRGPNTNGSQFFINLGENPHLNGKHTVFGKVLDGFDVVEDIARSKVDNRDKPEKDVVIKSIRVLK